MASYRRSTFLFWFLLQAFLLLSFTVVQSKDDDENNLLQGLNSYRQSQNLPILAKNDKAGCLADKIAEKLEDQPCPAGRSIAVAQLSNYADSMDKCGIGMNNTREGVVLPVCVSKLVPTLVLTNYTQTQFARYINDTRFVGAGLGSEDDWMVVVLSTGTPGGSFARAHRSIPTAGFTGLSLLVGMLLLLFV
ncbi:unnamed protein product [Linum tenue]|uniref:Uncharacterized GPI-anchored protein At5g19230-like domain-containing protein n=1 Tax=Linum tenue TaxID=586396 RepID=A0AAV0JF37_9ROSI|nr:unnamed protein product [Linum tenue]